MLRRFVPSLLGGLASILLASTALADTARLQALGDVDLLIEDSTNVFTNPALIGTYSNRAWFSLGVQVPAGGGVQLSPLGGGAVRIKDVVTLGVVLNRSPRLYGFDRALWPVMQAYLPQGPGGPIAGPDGPVEDSAPLVFPLDFFVGAGDRYSPLRVGLNVYYAGGVRRTWEIDDRDLDDNEDSLVVRKQTHLINITAGISGGTPASKVRPEAWLRFGHMAAWHDEVAEAGTDSGAEPTIDRILTMERDLRVGGGFRLHIGDSNQGILVTPGVQYDGAGGAFRYDDNLANPDTEAEKATRVADAHHGQVGVGVAWRGEGLLVQGTASLGMAARRVIDTLEPDPDELEESRTFVVDASLPELSIGAEYRVLPPLWIRAGIRSAVVGGRTIGSSREAEGGVDSLVDTVVVQTIEPAPAAVTLSASGGIGLEVKRFKLDALLGSLVLPEGGGAPNFFSRVDLAFSFD